MPSLTERPLRRAAAGIVCAAAVVLAAQGLTALVQARAAGLLTQVQQLASRSVQGLENLMHWRNVGVALQYLGAATDAAVQGETGLHFSGTQLLAVLSALGPEVDVAAIEQDGDTLRLMCAAPSQQHARTLCEGLRASGAFGRVSWHGTGWQGQLLYFWVEAGPPAPREPILPLPGDR